VQIMELLSVPFFSSCYCCCSNQSVFSTLASDSHNLYSFRLRCFSPILYKSKITCCFNLSVFRCSVCFSISKVHFMGSSTSSCLSSHFCNSDLGYQCCVCYSLGGSATWHCLSRVRNTLGILVHRITSLINT
jgi:hypothetical protein